MENGNKNTNGEQNSGEINSSERQPTSIFTKDEIRSIVRRFVTAWIEGDVTIQFPTSAEIVAQVKKIGKHVDQKSVDECVVKEKSDFVDRVSIIVGNTQSKEQERELVISEMFKYIMILRCGGRIKGNFGRKEDYEARLARVEEEINAMNAMIEELVIAVRSLQNAR